MHFCQKHECFESIFLICISTKCLNVLRGKTAAFAILWLIIFESVKGLSLEFYLKGLSLKISRVLRTQ